ncbi:MAG: PIN domain-containing protein [Acidobacteria bacterium]|nr:PIN domain-containing protein [Acidobacteriota bacterium]
MTTFVDTSAIHAVFDRDDTNHARAAETWHRLVGDGAPLLTTNYVLLETSALLQRRLGLADLRAFHESVAPLLEIHWIDEARHQAAVEAVLAAGKRKLSVVDCASFQVMRQLGVHTVFCFDEHFREQEFEVIP